MSEVPSLVIEVDHKDKRLEIFSEAERRCGEIFREAHIAAQEAATRLGLEGGLQLTHAMLLAATARLHFIATSVVMDGCGGSYDDAIRIAQESLRFESIKIRSGNALNAKVEKIFKEASK
jgi:hypothetical protein